MRLIHMRHKVHALKRIGVVYEDPEAVYDILSEKMGPRARLLMDEEGNFFEPNHVPVELQEGNPKEPKAPSAPPGATWEDGLFICNGCGKSLKTEKGMENHLAKCGE